MAANVRGFNANVQYGGIATAEFKSIKACQNAGKRWMRQVSEGIGGRRKQANFTSYLCVGSK